MINLQDAFLNKLRTQKMPITIILVNGFQIKGTIQAFDTYVVLVENEKKQNMIYKHAISTIKPERSVTLDPPAKSAGDSSN